jgi:hypothetical protein
LYVNLPCDHFVFNRIIFLSCFCLLGHCVTVETLNNKSATKEAAVD